METKSQLEFRKSFCNLCIETLEGLEDPRKDAALENYRAQLEMIERKIKELETGEPEPIVIALKPALLFGKSGG